MATVGGALAVNKSPGYVYLCTICPKLEHFLSTLVQNFMFKLTLNVEMNVLINPRKQNDAKNAEKRKRKTNKSIL